MATMAQISMAFSRERRQYKRPKNFFMAVVSF
jgi:hypothetical protein